MNRPMGPPLHRQWTDDNGVTHHELAYPDGRWVWWSDHRSDAPRGVQFEWPEGWRELGWIEGDGDVSEVFRAP